MNSSGHFRILVPGSILLDIYADTGQRYLGGAEFNFAYHAQQLLGGVDFIARIGQDEAGEFIWNELVKRGFPTEFIQIDHKQRTKTVQVQTDERHQPVFIIPSNVASEYLEYPPLADEELSAYDLVYFGTTLQYGETSRSTLRHILAKCRGLKFCDLNLRSDKYSRETVDYSLRTCDFLKINREELEVISRFNHIPGGRRAKLQWISDQFHIPGICLTLGASGSLLLREGQVFEKHLSPGHAVDPVGAGDGFSACLVAGILNQWDPVKALDFASDFSAAICHIKGAVPEDRKFYAPFIRSTFL